MGLQRLCLISIMILILDQRVNADDNITELVAMISEGLTEALSYKLPKNNKRLLGTSSSDTYDFGTVDFIVVGAGSSGAVVANRLSEISGWNILLLEAGGVPTEFSKILALWPYLAFTDMNWGYNTTTQKNICQGTINRQCLYTRGLVRGGSSAINGGVYTRGNRQDFDIWADMGNQGWSYNAVLPYFKKSENAVFPTREQNYHGEGGYLYVDVPPGDSEFHTTFTDALEEFGIAKVDDYNGKTQLGVGRMQFTAKYNKRDSTSSAFLEPFTNRENLQISLNSFVTKLILHKNSKTVCGVEFIKNGKKYIAKARKEVILSAGFVNSPQILLLSGIGPKKDLKGLGIEVIKNLPVGKFMQDQVLVALQYRTNQTFYNITLTEEVELYLQNQGPLATPVELVSFINLKNSSSDRPDIEYMFSTAGGDPSYAFQLDSSVVKADVNPLTDAMLYVVLLHPESRGTVKLKSNSPLDFPLIDLNLLSDLLNTDTKKIYKGIKRLIKLSKTEALSRYGAVFKYMEPLKCNSRYAKETRRWWSCAIRAWSIPGLHGVGTTRMGMCEETSVVNSRLQVHGIERLRVVDAGVMPDIISGHTNAATIMIGEKAADLIKEDFGML